MARGQVLGPEQAPELGQALGPEQAPEQALGPGLARGPTLAIARLRYLQCVKKPE
jgi:hypothetical protein